MNIREFTKAVIDAHTSIEYLANLVDSAVNDSRFRLTLADHRKFRELANDMEVLAARAGRESIKIPAELPVNGQLQKITIK